jgi:hypothetical protein
MRTNQLWMTTAIVLAASSLAAAEPLQLSPPDRRDHSRVSATIGAFTPAGDVAVEYSQAMHTNVEVAVGAGYGILVRTGPQFSLMPRGRVRLGAVTFSLGAGLSAGRYNNISPFERSDAPEIMTLWGNAEAAIQVTSKRGPFARAFAGAGAQLAHGQYDKNDPDLRMETDDVIPYLGLGVGWVL